MGKREYPPPKAISSIHHWMLNVRCWTFICYFLPTECPSLEIEYWLLDIEKNVRNTYFLSLNSSSHFTLVLTADRTEASVSVVASRCVPVLATTTQVVGVAPPATTPKTAVRPIRRAVIAPFINIS